MAYTIENTYTGNNSTVLYSFTFPYLETTDIKVTLDEVANTAWTLASATQIQFNSAPGSNVAIRIYRDTNIDSLQSEFFSGSAIRSQDLNNDFNQTLYVSQETEAATLNKWNKTTDTIDSTEAFADVNTKIMTAAAIDDRINANIAVQPLANGKILAGNGSGVAAAVTPSGDLTMANTGAFTIAPGSVEHAMLANDAVDGDNIADDSVDSEHYVDGSIDAAHLANDSVNVHKLADNAVVNASIDASAAIAHSKLASITSGRILVGNGSNVPTAVAVSGDVTLANTGAVTIANDAVETAMINNDAVDADKLASNAVVNDSIASGAAIAHSKLANVSNGSILVGNGSNVPTAVAVSGDVTLANTGAVTIASNAVEIGMIGCEETTITDDDTKIPTSGAVVDYVAAALLPFGGFEAIANEDSFPATNPAAGVIISIADATGITVDSSGVSETARQTGSGSDDVKITGFPATLTGGNGGQANPFPLPNNTGLLVVATGTQAAGKDVYTFHRLLPTSDDVKQLSDDVNDFFERYRINAGEPGSNNDDGDLVWDTSANKMKVYDATASAWTEVTSTGDFKFLVPVDAGTTTAATWDGSDTSFDLKETTNTGSAASVTSVNQLIVSLNGVIQKPNTGNYSASSEGFYLTDPDTIRFCTAPPSGSSAFIIQCGSAVSIPTPGTGSINNVNQFQAGIINAAAIGTGAVEHAKLDADCVDGDNLADNAVDSEHYTDGSIDNEHLADNAVDLAEMAHGTQGDVLYYGSGGAPTRLGAGTNGYYLKTQGSSANPVWAEVSAGITSDAQQNTTGGTNAGDSFSGTSAENNTLIGYNAGTAVSTGDNNTAYGHNAMAEMTTAAANTCIGVNAGTSIVDHSNNTYVGADSGRYNVGEKNIAVGVECLEGVDGTTNADANIAIGFQALHDCTTGGSNIAIGNHALDDVNTGTRNVAIGINAGQTTTTGTDNIAIGYQPMHDAATTGEMNICIGDYNGRKLTSGYKNVFIGSQSGLEMVSGHYATGCGHRTLHQVTGNGCTALGSHAGFDVTSGDNNTLIGDNAGRSMSPSGSVSTGDNVFCLGNNSVSALYCADTSISSSDQRDKTDFTEWTHGLDWINKLKPVTYRWDKRSWYSDDLSVTPNGSKKRARLHLGFKAQDVLAVEQADGFAGKKDDMLLINLNEDDTAYGMKYERLVVVLTKAVQELSAKNDALETRIAALEAG